MGRKNGTKKERLFNAIIGYGVNEPFNLSILLRNNLFIKPDQIKSEMQKQTSPYSCCLRFFKAYDLVEKRRVNEKMCYAFTKEHNHVTYNDFQLWSVKYDKVPRSKRKGKTQRKYKTEPSAFTMAEAELGRLIIDADKFVVKNGGPIALLKTGLKSIIQLVPRKGE
jgi:hypothetical protein